MAPGCVHLGLVCPFPVAARACRASLVVVVVGPGLGSPHPERVVLGKLAAFCGLGWLLASVTGLTDGVFCLLSLIRESRVIVKIKNAHKQKEY